MNAPDEVLPPEQQEVLRELGRHAADFGFYLGGGTAIAIHLGHRQSLDLDWFTSQRIENPLDLARELQDRGVNLQAGSVARGTLHGDVRGVRVSFLEYRHSLIVPPADRPDLGGRIASLEDLAAMKLLAVDQRGAKKDFVDIHALGVQGRSLAEMFDLFRRKFAVDDVSRVLYSLSYFDDAERDPMPKMLTNISWEQVKTDIRAWVKGIAMVE
ncbi:MAG: nucleotidyl transferase AbiEii/AbiGii toxin family protein [Pirellulales bacterium]|nr:nucleotidyl transferase AbiEii/AbiGii toxin family protein [Pirellulales bacterium]